MRDRSDTSEARHDIVVIGAGQAGLAIGSYLKSQGLDFVIVDRASSIGSAWQERWDSLTLFTPRRYDSLPGLPFPGDPDGYPNRDEVIAYLEEYARTLELPVQLSTPVQSLEQANGRLWMDLACKQQCDYSPKASRIHCTLAPAPSTRNTSKRHAVSRS